MRYLDADGRRPARKSRTLRCAGQHCNQDVKDWPGGPLRGRGSPLLENDKVLVGQDIQSLGHDETRLVQLRSDLLLGEFHRRGRPDWQVLLIEIDHHDTSARFQCFCKLCIIRWPALDVMQNIAEEDDIDRLRRKTRIVWNTEDG